MTTDLPPPGWAKAVIYEAKITDDVGRVSWRKTRRRYVSSYLFTGHDGSRKGYMWSVEVWQTGRVQVTMYGDNNPHPVDTPLTFAVLEMAGRMADVAHAYATEDAP